MNRSQTRKPAEIPPAPAERHPGTGYPWQLVFVLAVIAAGVLGIILMLAGVI
jgi:hypothetical protein